MDSSFKFRFLKTSAPTSIEGIEKYLASEMIRGIRPAYDKKLLGKLKEAKKGVTEIAAPPQKITSGPPVASLSRADAYCDRKSTIGGLHVAADRARQKSACKTAKLENIIMALPAAASHSDRRCPRPDCRATLAVGFQRHQRVDAVEKVAEELGVSLHLSLCKSVSSGSSFPFWRDWPV